MKILSKVIVFFLVLIVIFSSVEAQNGKVLIFSKTKGFRHGSIQKGTEVITKICNVQNIEVVATEDASVFQYKNLKEYDALIFLNSTGDLLDEKQQKALVKYMKNGGGFVGIHAATDAEYDWPWYGEMIGGYFLSHPKQQNAKVLIINKEHPSTEMLSDEWIRWDEWYDFKNVSPNITVLAKLDETSYEGGKMNNDHPIVWIQEFGGGRVFYTGFGHTDDTYDEPMIQIHIIKGILWAMGKID